jgi:hypothetical protein
MILTVKQTKLPTLETVLKMRIKGSAPTAATISWLKDAEKPELGTDETIVSVSNLGNLLFSLTVFIPAQSFWVKLDTESREFKLDNFFKSLDESDKPLQFSGNTSSFNLYVPHSNLGLLNIEIFTVDGVKLDTYGDRRVKFWDKVNSSSIFTGYTKPKLCNTLTVNNLWLKQGNGGWLPSGNYPSFYVRVSGLQKVVTNNLLLSTIVDEADYSITTLDKKGKDQSTSAAWGCTITA